LYKERARRKCYGTVERASMFTYGNKKKQIHITYNSRIEIAKVKLGQY
jgi:hypothetical protein